MDMELPPSNVCSHKMRDHDVRGHMVLRGHKISRLTFRGHKKQASSKFMKSLKMDIV